MSLRADCALRLKILIVFDVRFLGEGLGELLRREPALFVVGLAANAEEAVAKTREMAPDIVLVDAAMPNGLTVVRRVRELAAGVRVIALALNETAENVVTWAEAGAVGYVPRSASLNDLTAVFETVRRGEQTCSAAVAGGLFNYIASRAPRVDERLPDSLLTGREAQVSDLICAGLSDKDIARRLHIQLATVKSHVHNALRKLKMQRRSELAVWIRQHCAASSTVAFRTSAIFRIGSLPAGDVTPRSSASQHPVRAKG